MSKAVEKRGGSKPCVFIHVNHKQILGAHVGERSLRHFSRNNDKFDVKFIETKDHPFLLAREGEMFLRNGVKRKWRMNDLQSFTPLRFMPPELMNYRGRAVVIDPDVFAVGDAWDLLSRDMEGKAIMCRPRSKISRNINGKLASNVMLLDCAKLRHWKVEHQFNEMFGGQQDYGKWITLMYEDRSTIGFLENSWNDLTGLKKITRMQHTSELSTQPWNTGLPIDFVRADKHDAFPSPSWLSCFHRKIVGDHSLLGHHKTQPDKNREDLFFALLLECFDDGTVTGDMVQNEMLPYYARQDVITSRSMSTRPGAKHPFPPSSWMSASPPPPQNSRVRDSIPLQTIARATAPTWARAIS